MAIVTRTGAVSGAAAFSTYPHTTAFEGNTAVDRCNNDGFLYSLQLDFPFLLAALPKVYLIARS